MMWIWIVGGVLAVVLLVFVIGSLLPESYRARGHVDLDVSPDQLWEMLSDYESTPMAAKMARSIETLPAENGLPVWIEDMGSTKVRVATVAAERPTHLVREMADRVVPMTARVVAPLRMTNGIVNAGVANFTKHLAGHAAADRRIA